ncbi:uncharacterized protein LOC131689862 [Topomyia yanbarensis]|uniref:uncharacterized protein LOC131689862 n=1 Tax=Topomyia yanbarensis TaxID=2498891 RepID=UPI00273BB290|nr:uncharacterized protein LOC131689862 [Topomyia yanbarensis]
MCRNYENNSIMAHGLHSMIKSEIGCSNSKPRMEQQRPGGGAVGNSSGTAGKMGSRRIFPPQFKLQVLDSYRNDSDCKGNQRATARKYGIHRRQIQKWLQVENNLRSAAANSASNGTAVSAMKINLMSNSGNHHPPQFQLHHPHHHIHQQNLNSIELKVPLDSTRHRVAQNATSNNNNNNINGNSKESSVSACIISPVPTHTMPSPFSHPHETSSSSSSASLSVLKPHSRESAATVTATALVSQVLRPNFSPVSGDFPAVATPTHHHSAGYEQQLNLLDTYYHYHYSKYASDCPIDLSLPQPFRGRMDQALSPCSTISSVYSSRPRSPTPAPPVQIKCEVRDPSEDCEAVDLSCRKRKSAASGCDDSADGASPPKSVKLFKPYLLDEKDDEKDSSIYSPVAAESPKDAVGSAGRLDYPIIWNFHAHQQQRYYENLYECSSGPYAYPPSPPYGKQPLTPIPRTAYSTLSPSPPSSGVWAAPQASPVSGYDSSTSISSVYSTDGNDDGYSYSYRLELKQQAIDSYYHDVSCRGDFRAVASKYNINRKYVEKWLAQDEHLATGVVSSSNQPPPLPPQVVVGARISFRNAFYLLNTQVYTINPVIFPRSPSIM